MDSTTETTEATRISEEDLKVLRKLAVIGKYDFLMNEGPKFKNVDIDTFSTTRIRKDAENSVKAQIETRLAEIEKDHLCLKA